MDCDSNAKTSQVINFPMVGADSATEQENNKNIEKHIFENNSGNEHDGYDEFMTDFDNASKYINDLMESDLEKCNTSKEEVELDKCKHGHDVRVCDPDYDGHHAMSYYDDLWSGLSCTKADCSNAGLSFGQLIKKKIKVHYCRFCQNYEGYNRCKHVICDVCKLKEEESNGGNRRSKRHRKCMG